MPRCSAARAAGVQLGQQRGLDRLRPRFARAGNVAGGDGGGHDGLQHLMDEDAAVGRPEGQQIVEPVGLPHAEHVADEVRVRAAGPGLERGRRRGTAGGEVDPFGGELGQVAVESREAVALARPGEGERLAEWDVIAGQRMGLEGRAGAPDRGELGDRHLLLRAGRSGGGRRRPRPARARGPSRRAAQPVEERAVADRAGGRLPGPQVGQPARRRVRPTRPQLGCWSAGHHGDAGRPRDGQELVVEECPPVGRGAQGPAGAAAAGLGEERILGQDARQATFDEAQHDHEVGLDPHRQGDGPDEEAFAEAPHGAQPVGQLRVDRGAQHGAVDGGPRATASRSAARRSCARRQRHAGQHPLDLLGRADLVGRPARPSRRRAQDVVQQRPGPGGVRRPGPAVRRLQEVGQHHHEPGQFFGPLGPRLPPVRPTRLGLRPAARGPRCHDRRGRGRRAAAPTGPARRRRRPRGRAVPRRPPAGRRPVGPRPAARTRRGGAGRGGRRPAVPAGCGRRPARPAARPSPRSRGGGRPPGARPAAGRRPRQARTRPPPAPAGCRPQRRGALSAGPPGPHRPRRPRPPAPGWGAAAHRNSGRAAAVGSGAPNRSAMRTPGPLAAPVPPSRTVT